MGVVADQGSDIVILTSDNPRSEEPKAIVEDIRSGIDRSRNETNLLIDCDRRRAIHQGLELARSGDAVLIFGKGHEEYQILRDRVVPFSDRQVVEEWLSGHAYPSSNRRVC